MLVEAFAATCAGQRDVRRRAHSMWSWRPALDAGYPTEFPAALTAPGVRLSIRTRLSTGMIPLPLPWSDWPDPSEDAPPSSPTWRRGKTITGPPGGVKKRSRRTQELARCHGRAFGAPADGA
jgi:hypothetical protein